MKNADFAIGKWDVNPQGEIGSIYFLNPDTQFKYLGVQFTKDTPVIYGWLPVTLMVNLRVSED